MDPDKTALVVGSNGLLGRHIVEFLANEPAWRTISCSRQGNPALEGSDHVAGVDLTSAPSTGRLREALREATHVFYVARFASRDPETEASVNAAMLRNLLDAVEAFGENVRHVQVVHGTKWYGSHLGAYRTPAREDDPRQGSASFYYAQQDMLAERSKVAPWTWSALRPHTICGSGAGHTHSLVPLLGAYAALCRHIGTPLIFPGSNECFESVSQVTDAGLLAEAAVWTANSPHCGGEAFNIVNADYFRWCNIWPQIADFFGIAPGPVQPIRLGDYISSLAPAWEQLACRHGLRVEHVEDVGNWRYLDRILRSDHDDMSSTAKIRRYGFNRVVETQDMFLRLFGCLRDDKVVP